MEKLYSLFLFFANKITSRPNIPYNRVEENIYSIFSNCKIKQISISRAYFLGNDFPDLTIELFISVDNIPIFSGLLFYLFGENARVSISRLLFPQVLSL